MTDMHRKSREHEQREAERRVRRAGYGDLHQDRATANAAVHAHERHDHKGEPLTKLRKRRGGKVPGRKPARRIDRRARGGALNDGGWDGVHGAGPDSHPKKPAKAAGKGKRKGATHLTIEIHNSNPGERQQAAQMGMHKGMQLGAQMGARAAASRMGRPPAPPPAPMAPPMGAGAAPPMMGAAGAPGGMPPRPPMGAAQAVARGGQVKPRARTYRRVAGGRLVHAD